MTITKFRLFWSISSAIFWTSMRMFVIYTFFLHRAVQMFSSNSTSFTRKTIHFSTGFTSVWWTVRLLFESDLLNIINESISKTDIDLLSSSHPKNSVWGLRRFIFLQRQFRLVRIVSIWHVEHPWMRRASQDWIDVSLLSKSRSIVTFSSCNSIKHYWFCKSINENRSIIIEHVFHTDLFRSTKYLASIIHWLWMIFTNKEQKIKHEMMLIVRQAVNRKMDSADRR